MSKIYIAFSPNSDTQLLRMLTLAEVAQPLSIGQLIKSLGWDSQYPQILAYSVGVFSQKVTWDYQVKAGDRVEIYRPLTITPMQKRQLLMQKRQKTLNTARAKRNIEKKQLDKKAYFNALRHNQTITRKPNT